MSGCSRVARLEKKRRSGKLTGLPFEAGTLERVRSTLVMIGPDVHNSAVTRGIKGVVALWFLVAVGGLGRRVGEGRLLVGVLVLWLAGKASVLEDGGHGRADAIWAIRRLRLNIVGNPLGRQDLFGGGELIEALRIAAEPEIELEILGGKLNIFEVVHEVTGCARLATLGQSFVR